jgi:N-glycosylase/DNA lyase
MDSLVANPTPEASCSKAFQIQDYDLSATLTSGQAFRWRRAGESWLGVIGTRWVRLRADHQSILAEAAEPVSDWSWLTDYLQFDLNLEEMLASFPDDEPMRMAVKNCRGLRLLRQEPWECLASFILSSTKQISQIQQIISLLCEAYGEPVAVPSGAAPVRRFPSPAQLAHLGEAELRACKMGFRAPYLLTTANTIVSGRLDLDELYQLPLEQARARLMDLPGVGRKIADCVLLFAYGFQEAFPVDVWVMKALRQLYFPKRAVTMKRLHRFASEHFGRNAGYAQQYLFHYMRTVHAPNSKGRLPNAARGRRVPRSATRSS